MIERSIPQADPRIDPLVRSADELLAIEVVDSDGELLGRLSEIMLDVPAGRIAYGVLTPSDSVDASGRLHAVPWELLRPCERAAVLRLEADRDVLRSAPSFDPDEWPDMSERRWSAELHAHYGLAPYWTGGREASE
jgi:sporulation protein YlmC with PRC-barrel domain